MSDETLDNLLSQLNAGDEAAAERTFVAYEPRHGKSKSSLLSNCVQKQESQPGLVNKNE
jgi:hypothetical protein